MNIRHSLMHRISLYNLPGPIYKNSSGRETLKKGVVQNALVALSTKMPLSLNVLSIILRSHNRREIAFNTKS